MPHHAQARRPLKLDVGKLKQVMLHFLAPLLPWHVKGVCHAACVAQEAAGFACLWRWLPRANCMRRCLSCGVSCSCAGSEHGRKSACAITRRVQLSGMPQTHWPWQHRGGEHQSNKRQQAVSGPVCSMPKHAGWASVLLCSSSSVSTVGVTFSGTLTGCTDLTTTDTRNGGRRFCSFRTGNAQSRGACSMLMDTESGMLPCTCEPRWVLKAGCKTAERKHISVTEQVHQPATVWSACVGGSVKGACSRHGCRLT